MAPKPNTTRPQTLRILNLRARPIFHHTRDAIEAHLTIVFTALAVERYLYAATGWSKKRIITTLKPIVEAHM